jgi:hypothetical protein
MFGSVVTLDKASGAFGKVGIEIYTPFPPPIASLNLPDARTSCFRYRSDANSCFPELLLAVATVDMACCYCTLAIGGGNGGVLRERLSGPLFTH